MACSSASVMAQPQVNSTVRRRVLSDSRWLTSSWLAPAPFMLVAPSTIATAMETSVMPRSTSGNLPARSSAGPSPPVSPARSASLRSSTAPACPISRRPQR